MNRHYNRIMNSTLIERPPGYKRKGMKLGTTGMNIYPAMKKKQTNKQQNVSASLLTRLSYSKSEQNNSLLKK